MNKAVVEESCEIFFNKIPNTAAITVMELNCGCAILWGWTEKGNPSTPHFI
jgi:hypothetical protein